MTQHMSLWWIFSTAAVAGMAAVGGGSGTVAVAQGYWVGGGLVDPGLFTWAVALGQLTPGPYSVLLVALGYYVGGIPGAIAAVAGVCLPTWIVCGIAASAMERFRRFMQPLLRPAGFVVGGLATAVAYDTGASLHLSAWELAAVAVVAYLVGWRKLDPVWVIGAALAVGLVMYFA